MTDNPFDQTTLTDTPQETSTPLSAGEGVEVRYPPASRVLAPAAVVCSGLIAPIVIFFTVSSPINIIVAALIAITDLGMAAFLWFLFNTAFVRADERGVSKSQLGKTTTVSWEKIAAIECDSYVYKGNTTYRLKNAQGEVLMTYTDLANKADGEKLRDFIARRLSPH